MPVPYATLLFVVTTTLLMQGDASWWWFVSSFTPVAVVSTHTHTMDTTSTPRTPFLSLRSTNPNNEEPKKQEKEEEEEEEDWFADYDPALYEHVPTNQEGFSSSGNYGTTTTHDAASWHHQKQPTQPKAQGTTQNTKRTTTHRKSRSTRLLYHRDTSRDETDVDVPAIERLLQQRTEAKYAKQFSRADAIRDTLMMTHGVGVFDQEKLWRSGCSTQTYQKTKGRKEKYDQNKKANRHNHNNKFGSRTNHNNNNNNSNNQSPPHRPRREDGDATTTTMPPQQQQQRKQPPPPPPTPQDIVYTKSKFSPEVQGVDDAFINQIMIERSTCQRLRDFEKADQIREGLQTNFNININDRLKQWSVGTHFDFQNNNNNSNHNNNDDDDAAPPPPQEKGSAPKGAPPATQARARTKGRQHKNVTGKEDEDDAVFAFTYPASYYEDEDDEGTTPGIEPLLEFYTQSPESKATCLSPMDTETISLLVSGRYVALTEEHDHDTAHEIQEELFTEFDVIINDATKEWTYIGNGTVDDEGEDRQDTIPEQPIQSKFIDDIDAFFGDDDDDMLDQEELFPADPDMWRRKPGEQDNEDGDDNKKQQEESPNWKDHDNNTITINNKDDDEEREQKKKRTPSQQEPQKEESISRKKSNNHNEHDNTSKNNNNNTHNYSRYNKEELSSLTVVKLKEKLREAGLKVSGRKAELIERLLTQQQQDILK